MPDWPFGKRRWLAKHLAGFSATGRVMHRRKEWEHDLCPRCEAPNEDGFHVPACHHPSACLHFHQSVDTAMITLDYIGTHPDIVLLFKSISCLGAVHLLVTLHITPVPPKFLKPCKNRMLWAGTEL
jgi:hypothetical protein